MSDHDFQLQMIEGMAELRTDMKAVKEHLKTLNGKVAAHEKELAENRGAARASKGWFQVLLPILKSAAGLLIAAVFLLVLSNATAFTAFLH